MNRCGALSISAPTRWTVHRTRIKEPPTWLMGMPGFFHSLRFLGHGLAGMRRNILNFTGIKPVRETLFGMVAAGSDKKRKRWIEQMRRLGERAG